MKIPFGLLPASWGLRGESRELARAEYELDGEDLDRRKAEIKYTGNELDLHLLEIDHKYEKITKLEYVKTKASLKGEPWVHGELKHDANGYFFDLDWNEFFIAELKEKGYTGFKDEDLVDQWLGSLYNNELFSGFDSGFDMDPARTVRTETNNGKASYS